MQLLYTVCELTPQSEKDAFCWVGECVFVCVCERAKVFFNILIITSQSLFVVVVVV